MNGKLPVVRSIIWAVALLPAAVLADDRELAQHVERVLNKACGRCHGPGGTNDGGINYILDVPTLLAKKKVIAGAPSQSLLLEKIRNGEMPPEGEEPRVSDSETALLEQWIEQGALAFVAGDGGSRTFRTAADDIRSMAEYLERLPARQRRHQRFFLVTHQHNNPRVGADALRLLRAAVSKLANSLSWHKAIVLPQATDATETVLAIDLRSFGWSAETWQEIVRVYPYGLSLEQSGDESTRRLAAALCEMTDAELPFLRADWFVATASRPPLYHTLLELPEQAAELERRLQVDPVKNFLDDRVARAGFATSGVSGQNRLVERHDSPFGAYWKSYDFKTNEGDGNLFRLPLGPRFATNPFVQQAFVHDGGELIFHLPNGLQGYLLVDGQDRRIDEGPIEVVSDSLKTSGTAKIVNGLSCMACHGHGMRADFKDTVREGTALAGTARDKVHRLYVAPSEMERLLTADSEIFLAALMRAIGPFVRVGDAKDKSLRSFAEPIGQVARQYILKELTLEDAALELGLADPRLLQAAILNNPRLTELGLKPLATGATIKRESWESRDRFLSPFQEAASALELGVPKIVQ